MKVNVVQTVHYKNIETVTYESNTLDMDVLPPIGTVFTVRRSPSILTGRVKEYRFDADDYRSKVKVSVVLEDKNDDEALWTIKYQLNGITLWTEKVVSKNPVTNRNLTVGQKRYIYLDTENFKFDGRVEVISGYTNSASYEVIVQVKDITPAEERPNELPTN